MIKRIKKITYIVLTIFTMLLFLTLLSLIVLGVKAKKSNQPLAILGYHYSIVGSESMEPRMMVGDIFFFKKKPYEQIKDYDIIVFYSERYKINIVHEAIRLEEDGWVTKGIHNIEEDRDKVTKEHYLGTVTMIVPFGDAGQFIIKNRVKILSMLAIFFFIFVIVNILEITYYVVKLRKEKIRLQWKEELLQELKSTPELELSKEEKSQEEG